MKSRIKRSEGTARHLEIEMPKQAVENVFGQVLEDIRKTAKIPGFRQGKAPLDIIQKKHYESAMDEVKQRLIPQAYQQALEEHNVNPVSHPEISDVNIELSGGLTFRAKVDAYPEVNLRKYKGLKAHTRKFSVTDDELEEALTRIRNMYAEFNGTDRPLQRGDFGICDVETFINGEVIARKRKNMWIEADKEASMLGMGEELFGLKTGDKKDIEVTLPENYPDRKYAGKKAVFRVEVKETKEKKLPGIDDELAKKMGKDSLAEARQGLRMQLMKKKESNARVDMKNQIMEQLLKKHPFGLPASIVSRQLKVLMEKAENELVQKGVDREAIDAHKEKLRGQLLRDAENKVRLYFILDAIADREKIEVTDEDMNDWLKSLADSYNQSFEDVKKYYQDQGLTGGLKEQLREEKTLDFLLREAVIVKMK